MALLIVLSTGVLKYVGMYFQCYSVNKKVSNGLFGLNDFSDCVIILSVIHCIQNSGQMFISNT